MTGSALVQNRLFIGDLRNPTLTIREGGSGNNCQSIIEPSRVMAHFDILAVPIVVAHPLH